MIPNCLYLSGRASLLITASLGPILLLSELQTPPLHAAPEPKSPAEVETLALQARQNLQTLYVKLHFDSHVVDKNRHTTGTRTIWVSGDRIRDEVTYAKGGPIPPDKRMVSCLHCEKPNHLLYWWETETPLRAILDEHSVAQGQKYPPTPLNAIDPRLLGYICAPSTMLYPFQFSLDHHLGSNHPGLRRESVQMEVTRWNGMRCYLLHSILTEGAEQKVWIAPDHGYNIVRITCNSPGQDAEVVTELQAVGPHKIWFPKQVKFQTRSNGTLSRQETVQILEVRLNEEIPPSTFTLAGCLPDGTPVRIYSGGQSIYGTLKNGKVEKDPEVSAASRRQELLAATPPPPQPLQEQRRWDPWLVLAAISLTLGALLVLWLWRRSTLPGRS